MKKIFLIILLCISLPSFIKAESTKDSYYVRVALELMRSNEEKAALQNLFKELENNPTNGFAHLLIASICCDMDSYGYGLEHALSALKYLPKSEHVAREAMYNLLSRLYLQAKDTTLALQYRELARKELPKKERNYFWLVDLNMDKCDTIEATRYAQMYLKLLPDSIDAYLTMANIQSAYKRYDEAIDYCSKALKMAKPNSKDMSRVLLRRALLFEHAKRPSEALTGLMQATRISIWNQTETLLYRLVDTIPDEVLDTLLAAKRAEPDQIYWDILLFDFYQVRNEYEKAVLIGYELLPKYNNNSLVYELASILELNIGDLDLAEKLLLKQLDTDSTSAMTYINLQELYSERNCRYAESLEMAEKALSFSPTDHQKTIIYQLRGRMQEQRHEYQAAINDFIISMIAYPDDCEIWFSIGKLYGLLNDKEKQQAAFEQGRKAYALRGYELSAGNYVALGDTAAAYEAAKTMVKKENSPTQHYNKACIYAQIGHYTEALQELRIAIEYGFRCFNHIEWDSDLDNLRGMPEYITLINEYKQLNEQQKQELRSKLNLE